MTIAGRSVKCVSGITARWREVRCYVQRLDSGLVDEDQEPPDELHYLTEDDLPSEIPSSDVALRELEEFLRQNQQDPGPHSGSDDLSDSA